MKAKIALIQTNPQTNLQQNLEMIESLVAAASTDTTVSDSRLDLVVLPEMFSYMGNEEGRLQTADNLGEGVFLWLQKLALKYKVHLHGGSHAEKVNEQNKLASANMVETKKVFNTSVVYSPQGDVVSVYRKVHLFNLRDAFGKSIYCESDVFLAGNNSTAFDLNFSTGARTRCLNTICYDLRFPELFRSFNAERAREKFDIIFVPAAFTFQTGIDHWEVLLRARAIENQCFVVAVNQSGFHSAGKKRNFGHSMVVNPWGKVIRSLQEEEGYLVCEINLEEITEARTKLPALADRRV